MGSVHQGSEPDANPCAAARRRCLEIAEDAAVWELRRLKLQETTPVMLSTHYLPVEIYPTLDDRLLSMISCEMMATLRRYSGVLSRKSGTTFPNAHGTRAVGC
ncbi:UTRA domain-containing protein [Corynebacterium sp.]|uniref:UTRA domain-containing protein n=1 Tax=Corynebacterium sp. TaxID=1720 RepID=UPI0037BFF0A8